MGENTRPERGNKLYGTRVKEESRSRWGDRTSNPVAAENRALYGIKNTHKNRDL
jgi:hypothetical protein